MIVFKSLSISLTFMAVVVLLTVKYSDSAKTKITTTTTTSTRKPPLSFEPPVDDDRSIEDHHHSDDEDDDYEDEEEDDEHETTTTTTRTTRTSNTTTTTPKPKSNSKKIIKSPFLNTEIRFSSPSTPVRVKKLSLPSSSSIFDLQINKTNQTDGPEIKPNKEQKFKAPPMLKKIHDYLIVVLLVSVMFAMGCSITWSQVWNHVRKPIGVIIGMISQFILLPAAAYALIVLFKIEPLHATGLLILACSPGGVTSNVFTYFCEGDLSLSVTMTSFSTVVALLMMPFNVWLYGRNLETETLVIPYTKMTVSLLTLTAPVAVGMLVNWKLPKIAPILTKIGSISGFAIIIVCQTLEVFIFPDIFNDIPTVLYIAEFLLPLLGLALGFFASSLLRLPFPVRRTIAIEAGIQNVGTALTIITLSFPFEQLRKVWLFPFLYAFSMLAVCCIVAIIYRLQKHFYRRSKTMDIENVMDLSSATVSNAKNQSRPPVWTSRSSNEAQTRF